MNFSYIADLHAHPTLKAMLKGLSIWQASQNDCDSCPSVRLAKGMIVEDIATYSQADFSAYQAGKVRVVFIALHPPEAQYFGAKFKFPLNLVIRDEDKPDLGVCVSGFNRAFIEQKITEVEGKKSIDYYGELKQEYAFIFEQATQSQAGKEITIAANYEEVKTALANSPQGIVCIISVEGLHALNDFKSFKELLITFEEINNPALGYLAYYKEKYAQRIQEIKAWGEEIHPDKAGHYAPLYMTFNHHFWNLMGGQAQSIKLDEVDQSWGMNQPMTELGKYVLELLLDRSNGKRILIDVKHMSTATRKDFYQIWERYKTQGDVIPIICSHTSVAGMKNLNDLDKNADMAEDDWFDSWRINLADDEIFRIAESGGLIGLILNGARILGGQIQVWVDEYKDLQATEARATLKKIYLAVLAQNIIHILRTHSTKGADCICIGSDFDGLIKPLLGFETAEYLQDLRAGLIDYLSNFDTRHYPDEYRMAFQMRYKSYYKYKLTDFEAIMKDRNVVELVDKIMYKNVERFLETYFNDDYLRNGLLA